MNRTGPAILELREYTLQPRQRDVLIELFDREFVESQESLGMTVLGQFRDLDRPDRFVWLRGFADLPSRAEGLAAFYGGPVWRAHGAAANATMIDSDSVHLLRPLTADSGFPLLPERTPVGRDEPPASRILVTLIHGSEPFGDHSAGLTTAQVFGGERLAVFRTEYAENNFPALPVRSGEHLLAVFTRFADEEQLSDALARSGDRTAAVGHLRLAPTGRSRLR